MIAIWKKYAQGIFICLIVATVANLLAQRYQAPVMLFSLLLGLALHSFYHSPKRIEGITFCGTSLLRIAIALLGVRIVFDDIISLGYIAPLIVIFSMLATFGFAIFVAKLLGLPATFGVLTGGSVAICGVSAAAAISTVIPHHKDHEKFFALTVISITALSTSAMIFYPILASYLGLSEEMAGVFLGGAIHDVAQVVGAGYSMSHETGDIATYIKLLRVALLMPIVMLIFITFNRKNKAMKQSASAFVPPFLIAFILLAIANNIGFISTEIVEITNHLSRWALIVAMAAIGMKTPLGQVLSVGWKPIVLLTSETIFFASLILLGIYCFT